MKYGAERGGVEQYVQERGDCKDIRVKNFTSVWIKIITSPDEGAEQTDEDITEDRYVDEVAVVEPLQDVFAT